MKNILFALTIVFGLSICRSQAIHPFTDTLKTITTKVDTTSPKYLYSYEGYHLTIWNAGTDTLLWRTDRDSSWAWFPIVPGGTQSTNIFLRYFYMKAKNTSTKAAVKGN
jgi:hypothetical protein